MNSRANNFCPSIRRLREESGWTIAQLAEAAGMPYGTLEKVERGAREPRWSTAVALADALGCALDELR